MKKKIQQACFEERCFPVEVADTTLSRMLGLMFRSSLHQEKGMLLAFARARNIPIWMFGMRISLDILWIDAEKRVVHIERNVSPCRGLFCPMLISPKRAQYVLEINAGAAEGIGIIEGAAMVLREEEKGYFSG